MERTALPSATLNRRPERCHQQLQFGAAGSSADDGQEKMKAARVRYRA